VSSEPRAGAGAGATFTLRLPVEEVTA